MVASTQRQSAQRCATHIIDEDRVRRAEAHLVDGLTATDERLLCPTDFAKPT
jgi:hypothetical protein